MTPTTPASKIRKTTPSTPGGGGRAKEEKILVTVRFRPLNGKEQAMYDLIAWDCADEQTIQYRDPNHERPSTSYTFDKVFDHTCSTNKVYQDGAKDVALSALTGINATIFAYGQTSSGKTYTMRGITENAVNDIFKHINNNNDKVFSLKFSALEIYNETVMDLLNRDSGPLRLLDDPEKGVIVEKLAEEVVKDNQHIKHLISICEAQRQVGETSLNDKSSRSHQIIKLTVESSITDKDGSVKSFIASLNFVDLAGSERASQTNADGTRLKEGSHINRSLLTLTTVIRKLSGARRNGHVPFRDSKLTRILQHALGGNARTAIICTANPALSHVEQTRNTLTFATSAKEVTNRAQVNMVNSDKNIVRNLQKEVARLEAELRTPSHDGSASSSFKILLLEKDLKIEQMEIEMKELKRQRDYVQFQLELERKSKKEHKAADQCGPSHHVVSLRQSVCFPDQSTLVHEIRKLEQKQKQLGDEATRAIEVLQKEVSAHKLGTQATADTIAKMLSEIEGMQALTTGINEEMSVNGDANLKDEIIRLNSQENTIASLERKLDNMQKSIDVLATSFVKSPQSKKKRNFPFVLNANTNVHNIIKSPCSPMTSSQGVTRHDVENRDPNSCTPPSRGSSVNVKKMQQMFKDAAEENIRSIRTYVTELKERVAKLQYQKQLLVCQVLELENNEAAAKDGDNVDEPGVPWPLLFEDQRRQIIMLWHLCHVSIVHRTQFYLLFKGDPADQIYMEVELKRLSWLEQHLAELGNASPALLGDDPPTSVSSSIKALRQEREYLAKRLGTKLTSEEREEMYEKWEIPAVGKQRRLQLLNKVWSDPLDMKNVKESAELVGRLIGFCESGQHVSKEMFELSFANPSDKRTWMGWNLISNLLHL